MPRLRYTRKIEFKDSSIMIGRIVRTCKYTPELVEIIDRSNIPIPTKDIEGWCGLNFTVDRIYKDNDTVVLKYKIPGTKFNCINVTWPIKGLCKVSGIKI